MPGFSDQKVVLVGGAARSGTTLTKSLISANSKCTACMDIEGSGIFQYRGPHGRQFHKTFHFIDEEEVYRFKGLVSFYDRVVHYLLKNSEASLFVDKVYRLDRFVILWIIRHLPNVKFVLLVRDGRDCYCSARRHKNVPQGKSVQSYARYWVNICKKIDRLQALDNVKVVYYEALASRPEPALGSIMSFLELNFEPTQLKPEVFGSGKLKANPNHKNLSQCVSAKSVRRYQSELSAEEIKSFEQIAGKYLKRHGYTIPE